MHRHHCVCSLNFTTSKLVYGCIQIWPIFLSTSVWIVLLHAFSSVRKSWVLCSVWNASDIMPSCNVLPAYIPLLHKKSCYASELYKNPVPIKTSYKTFCRHIQDTQRVLYLGLTFVTIFYQIKLLDNLYSQDQFHMTNHKFYRLLRVPTMFHQLLALTIRPPRHMEGWL
jgi:hypothetical protein